MEEKRTEVQERVGDKMNKTSLSFVFKSGEQLGGIQHQVRLKNKDQWAKMTCLIREKTINTFVSDGKLFVLKLLLTTEKQ